MKTIIYISYFVLLIMNSFAILGVGLAEYQAKGEVNVTVIVWAVLTAICFTFIANGLNKYLSSEE